jgi:hypothetical protein
MKILFYTVCTPDADAIACASLAKRSIMTTLGDVDFSIVFREGSSPKGYIDCEILCCPPIENEWVGNLRYSRLIFEMDYDAFVYVDSDILWFAKGFDFSKNMYCREEVSISNPYFCSQWNLKAPEKTKGVNSGFFCVDKKTGLNLAGFFADHLAKSNSSSMIENGKLEQSTFNLYLYGSRYRGWEDKSDDFKFRADQYYKLEDKNFHFNNNQSQMNKKLHSMILFLKNNQIEL